jgi:APA family basic amino acid/polyamine antiporter
VKLSEETKSPERTIPLALLLSLAITILLYILVAACAVSVAGWELIAGSQAPFAAVVYAAMGSDALYAISVIALFATANTALMFLLAASRITYGMAQAASLPAVLARVHGSRGTPWVAIVSLSLLSLIFLFFGDIAFVANVTNTTLFITFIAINAAVILLRHRQPDLPRPFRTPLSVGTVPLLPVLGIVFSVFLLLQQEFRILITSAILAVSAYGIFMLRGAWGHTPVKKG